MKIFARYAAAGAVLGLIAFLLAGGTPLRVALACSFALAPIAFYVGLARPLLFPYALYVLLIPFDNLLNFSGSGTVTKFLGVVSGLMLLFWCLRTRQAVSPPRAMWILGILVTWMAFSVLWAGDQQNALSSLLPYLGLALLYAALAITPVGTGDFRLLLFAVVIGGIVSAAYGLHAFRENPIILQAANPALRRLVVQAGNAQIDPNQFANALLFPLAALIMLGARTKWLVLKVASLAGVGLMVYALLMTGSREAIVALGCIFLYYILRSRHRLQLLVAVGFTGAVWMANSAAIWGRFSNAISSGGAGRTSVWSVGWEAFKHNWLAGSGIGGFPAAYDQFYLGVYQNYSNGWTSPAHNLLFHYGVELGIVGLGLVVWFCVAQFSGLRMIDRSSPLYDYRILIEATLIGLFVAAMFIDLFTYKYAWLIFAMAAQLRSVAVQHREAACPSQPGYSLPRYRPSKLRMARAVTIHP